MKNNFLKTFLSASAAFVLLTTAGCLKDEGFDNNEYGIKNPAGQPKGVLFQEAKVNAAGTQTPTIKGILPDATPQSVQTLVKIAADQAAASDIHIKLVANNDLLTGTGLTALDALYYTIASMDIVIPKGQKYVQFVITVPNASIIDPSVVYGLGFTISSVTESDYTIAANSKNLVVGIAIKNQWDGSYHSTGYFYHPSSPRAMDEEKDLPTVSANSVSCFLGDLGTQGYVALLTIDPVTNKVTITDYSTGIPILQWDDGLPTTSPGYTAQWDGSPLCNNTYDPATKTFYLRYGYVGGTGFRVSEEILVRD